MASRKQLLSVLNKLMSVESITGAAVITRDGLLIASKIVEDVDAETFAAMSATMVGAAETAVSELRKGEIERIIIESSETKIITKGAGPDAVLLSLVDPKANLGLVLIEIKKASKKIEGLMK